MKKDRYTEPVVEAEKEPEVKKETKTAFVEHKVIITIPKLNIRVKPDSTSEPIDAISLGQSVTIVEEKDGWGKLKFIDGWINLKYTRSE